MNETIKGLDNKTLWALLADIAQLLEIRKTSDTNKMEWYEQYKPDTNNPAFMYWYEQYKAIQKEIDSRLLNDF